MARRTISVRQRRQAMVCRHHLGGDAATPEAVTRAVVGLHATDPASVYLSVLARSTTSTLAEVSAAMYERRTLVRWMAMRRTLFLLPRADVPVVQAAISTPLAAVLRRRLVSQLKRNGTEPPIDGELETWLSSLQGRVEQALRARGSATGTELAADVSALRTFIPPRAASDRPQNLTFAALTMMSAQGRIVRGTPTGSWTSRHHRWEPVEHWWPDGLPELTAEDSQRELARRWLTRFGLATADDLQWWTGWNQATARHALRELPVEEVGLHGGTGIALTSDNPGDAATAPPTATLLPALDPTPMGWKRRDWFFGIPPAPRVRQPRQHRSHPLVGRRDHRLLGRHFRWRDPNGSARRPRRRCTLRRPGHRSATGSTAAGNRDHSRDPHARGTRTRRGNC